MAASRLLAGMAAIVAMVLLLTGAGSAKELTIGPHTDPARITVEPSPEAIALLPARLKQAGRVTVGLEANAGYPNSVTVNGSNYGLTVDLGRALGAALGLEVQEVTMPFSNVIPALGSGRIDMTPALVTDRADRRQVVDFVDASYSLAYAFLLNANSRLPSIDFASACGVTIGANSGSSQATRLAQASKECEAAGKSAIDIKLYPSVAETVLAVQSGRVEAGLVAASMAHFMLKGSPPGIRPGSPAQAERVGLVGSAFPKGSDLVPAFRAAMLSLYRSGAWKRMLEQYNDLDAYPPEAVITNTDVVPDRLPARLLP
jgi:polar amino acid transport system substrate-binding protein